jgi:hypothetical protein
MTAMTKLSSSTARRLLVILWFSFFFLNLIAVVYLYLANWIGAENFRASLAQLNSVYVTYLGVIAAFYFTAPATSVPSNPRTGITFTLALLVSLIWNSVILVFIMRTFFLWGPIEDSLEQIGYFGPLLSWLVAPAIGFYFANSIREQ